MSNDTFVMANLYPIARQRGFELTGEIRANEFTADFSSYFRKGGVEIEVSSDGGTGVIWGAAMVDAAENLTEVDEDNDPAGHAVRWMEAV